MSSADQIASAALQQLLVRRRRRAGKPVPARIETAEGRVEKAARRKKVKVDTSVDKELAYRMSVKALKKDTKKFDEAIETRKKILDLKSGKKKAVSKDFDDDDSESD